MRNSRSNVTLPIGALVLDGIGVLLAAGGLLVVFAPALLPEPLAAVVTPAVGWAASGVGTVLSAVASWGIVQALRDRQQQ